MFLKKIPCDSFKLSIYKHNLNDEEYLLSISLPLTIRVCKNILKSQ